MTTTFQLDTGGGAEVLQQMAAAAIKALTEKIAAESGPGVIVKYEVTDRAKGLIIVPAHRQATGGALTRAASTTGLEVKPHTPRERRAAGKARKK